MGLVEFHVHEVEAWATPRLVIFGESEATEETAERPERLGTETPSVRISGLDVTGRRRSLGLALFLLAVAVLVWLVRRR